MRRENVESDSKEIGAKRRTRLVPLGRPQYGEKSLLGQFLGLRGIVHTASEKSVYPLAVAQEEFGKGFVRTLFKFQDQLLIAGHRSPRARVPTAPSVTSSQFRWFYLCNVRRTRKVPELAVFFSRTRNKRKGAED